MLFEDTIFHPQGGGQPKDKGYIVLGESKYQITNAVADKETGKVAPLLFRYGTSWKAHKDSMLETQ